MRSFLLFGILVLAAVANAGCPWADLTLKPWGTASSWPTNAVPASGANVVIGAGMNIVLDVTPPSLSSVLVTDGGRLVWGNYEGLELVSGSVIVQSNGQFWVGSEDCLFTKSATITLTGSATSTNIAGFGNKVLGVGANGTLELHGAASTPTWTRLSQNFVPLSWKPASIGRGITIAAINPSSGATLDSKTFDTYLNTSNSDALVAWLAPWPAGTVISLVCADECSYKLTPAAKTALQGIGSVAVNQLLYRSGWACVGVKGAAAGTAVEDVKIETARPTNMVTRDFPSFRIQVQANQPYGGYFMVSSAGNPIITLADNVNWKVGQQIAIASSDNDYTHAEKNEIIACTTCAANQLKLKNVLNYIHWGQFENGVDERAEVGLLSRSILVRGLLADAADVWGGQTRILRNFTNAHIENVEFYQMGQQIIGSYPVHFHMASDVDAVGRYTKPAYVKGCAVHKTFNRCVTVHGTMGLLVQNNVAYDHMGHCYFLEDGSEIRNTLDRNLGIMTKYGTVLLSDRDPNTCADRSYCKGPATFWIENPNNIITNNVAAGSVAFGIWYLFPNRPHGLSAPLFPNVQPAYTPLGKCSGNIVHSCRATGFMVDDGVLTDQSSPYYLGITGARYRPHTLPTTSSPMVTANFYSITAHHCYQGMWLRGGDFRVHNSFFADNQISMALASEGTSPNDPGSSQQVLNSVFVGITQNNYSGIIYSRIMGFQIYDGPVGVINCTFYRFPNTGRNSSAISGHPNNVWQVATTNWVTGSKFVDVYQRFWYQEPYGDGDRNNIIRDLDGSVSGKPGQNIVKNLPIHQTKSCTARPDFNAIVCPNKYGQIFILNTNVTGTNFANTMPTMQLKRDAASSYTMDMTGIGSAQPRAQFQPIVLINDSYTLHFGHPSPPNLQITLQNFDPKDAVRIGVCYPPGTTFVVRSKVGNVFKQLPSLATLAAVDAHTNSTATGGYYWDNATGLLFVKIIEYTSRTGLNYCGSAGCEGIDIKATGPNVGVISGTCSGAYPKYAKAAN